VAPVFLFLAIVGRKHASGFAWSALVLLALGTAAAFIAVSTGEAAAELAERSEAINPVLMAHQEMAGQTRNLFAAVTAVYAVLLVMPIVTKRFWRPRYAPIVSGVMLIAVLAASLQLVRTAHQGGVLVHKFGVHTMMPPSP
jgi:uncharacterized membrane protein